MGNKNVLFLDDANTLPEGDKVPRKPGEDAPPTQPEGAAVLPPPEGDALLPPLPGVDAPPLFLKEMLNPLSW